MPFPRPRFTLRTLVLSIAAAALLFAWLKAVLYPGPPVAVIAAPTFRFSPMPQHAKGRHAFAFKNNGGSPLRLLFSETTVDMYGVYTLVKGKKVFPVKGGAVTIMPGRSENIFMEWETRECEGWFVKGTTFRTNDPRRQTVHLTVDGTVTK